MSINIKLRLPARATLFIGIVAAQACCATAARAQDPHMALASACMRAYGADIQRCMCWARVILSLLSPDDLRAVMSGYDTPSSQRAQRQAESACGLR
jgi:hypothetical protein